MANKINNHVNRLHRYLPFSPSHDQIYEEYQHSEDSLNIETQALNYLIEAITNKAKMIILTGDAGHGKTHLCRRVLEDYLGYDEDEARKLINKACDGSQLITHKDQRQEISALRIYKDFSELTINDAAQSVNNAWASDSDVTIICANEGRLRAVLESSEAKEGCTTLLKDFHSSFQNGRASTNGSIHIVNLNYQSVASSQRKSLLYTALNDWLSGSRWRICQECDSQKYCCIYRNRNMLSPQLSSIAERRRDRLESVFATVERLDTVVTIREMLMSIAYLLTGGLTCNDIHTKVRRKRLGWQPEFAYYNMLFTPPSNISYDKLSRIPVLLDISKLDPGNRAIRDIDERLINEQNIFDKGCIDIQFEYKEIDQHSLIDGANGIDEIIGNPRNKKERDKEAYFTQRVVKCLRRRVFFDDDLSEGEVINRIGFKHGDNFLSIMQGNMTRAEMTSLKSKVIAGLHTIQGLQMSTRETYLFLVDPAFGNVTSHAAIIARKIPTKNLKLLPMSEGWLINNDDSDKALINTVDWLDRYIVLRIEDANNFIDFHLNLMMFDCICRASAGYVAEEFYSHDIRRITNFLGRLSETISTKEEEISLFLHGSMHSISIDDGVIQVGGH